MTDKEILAAALEESGMKQADLARTLNVSRPTVSTNMRRENMGVRVFVRLLRVMGFAVYVGKEKGETLKPFWKLKED